MDKSSIPSLLLNSVCFQKLSNTWTSHKSPLSPRDNFQQTQSLSVWKKTLCCALLRVWLSSEATKAPGCKQMLLVHWGCVWKCHWDSASLWATEPFKCPFSPQPGMGKNNQKHRSEVLCPQTSMGILSLTPLEPGSHPMYLHFRFPVVNK